MIYGLLHRIMAAAEKRKYNRISFRNKGSNVVIMADCSFGHAENITIGDNVYIGPGAKFYGQGAINIGSGTIFGPGVTIYSANHRIDGRTELPFDRVIEPRLVEIGANTWVAGNVIFVPGSKVGEGSVVGAGSVVTKRFEPNCIIGGNPAKVIRQLDNDAYQALKSSDSIFMRIHAAVY